MPDADSFPRTFRIDGQFRRSCLYLVVGGWACTGLAIYIRLWIGKGVDSGLVVLSLLFCVAPVILWLYASTYRLRLDEWGLSRRRLAIWTRWPWEAFIKGKVSIDHHAFTYAARPIWDRWITTEFLSPDDRVFVQDMVESISPAECCAEGRRLKLAEDVTEATLGLIVAGKLCVTASGCELLGSRSWSLKWDDVTEFRLEGTKQGKHNIYRLTITPRDGNPIRGTLNHVGLPGVSLVPHMTGHDEWVVHVQRLVPERCWKYLRTWDELRSVEEGEFRRSHWNKQIRMMRWLQIVGWLFLPLCAAVFVPNMINAWNMPFLPIGWKLVFIGIAGLNIVQPTVLFVAFSIHLRRRFQELLKANEQSMATLEHVEFSHDPPSAMAEAYSTAHRPLS